MSKLKNLVGQKFGRLTVIERVGIDKWGNACWRAKCECGNEIVVVGNSLLMNHSKSCGCLQKDTLSEARTKHGMAGTPIYNLWCAIKHRCFNFNDTHYKNYGGRGITICDEWKDDFLTFYSYVSQLEHFGEDGYTLDRIDVNGNYEPGNIRWVKKAMQARNKCNSVYVDYNGVNMLLLDAAKITGIIYGTLKSRYNKGDRGDKLFRPVKKVMPKSDLLLIENNQVYATSLIIAEKFEKNHFDVLRTIENSLTTLRNIATQSNDSNFALVKIENSFIKGEYKDKKGEMRPIYYLNRDAFSLIVMGFTGEKALEWKWRYIQEFNRMETALKS